jgi:hypothetical protein
MNYSTKVFEEIEVVKTNTINYVSTGAKSPEEALEILDRFGYETYVTKEGDLWVKSWQIGAKDFVPSEQVAVIRSIRTSLERVNELDWLSNNLQNIRGRYSNQWVAVYSNEIIAAASNLPDLMNQIGGFDRPLITFIPAELVVWNFTYAS